MPKHQFTIRCMKFSLTIYLRRKRLYPQQSALREPHVPRLAPVPLRLLASGEHSPALLASQACGFSVCEAPSCVQHLQHFHRQRVRLYVARVDDSPLGNAESFEHDSVIVNVVVQNEDALGRIASVNRYDFALLNVHDADLDVEELRKNVHLDVSAPMLGIENP